MATVKRGEHGHPHESPIRIGHPSSGREEDDIWLGFTVADGQEVSITMGHDEALVFCAELVERLAMRVNPPKPPEAIRVLLGTEGRMEKEAKTLLELLEQHYYEP